MPHVGLDLLIVPLQLLSSKGWLCSLISQDLFLFTVSTLHPGVVYKGMFREDGYGGDCLWDNPTSRIMAMITKQAERLFIRGCLFGLNFVQDLQD